jgi:prevent-host-death family protein
MLATAGVRELRQSLGKYLDRVKEGESLVVTERGREVARLIPGGTVADSYAGLAERSGAAVPVERLEASRRRRDGRARDYSPGDVSLDPSLVRHGRVNGRYFRENFAQGGIDLVQVVPELVTNADSAIARGGRPSGRILLQLASPDPGFASEWKRAMRRLRAPALLEWRHELRCSDDGVGMDAAAVDRRLGALGVLPDAADQRGLFGRGLRDVWLAQGGGRLEGVRAGRLVESWFFPSGGDDPYAYVHVRDELADAVTRARLGFNGSGTRITVPLATGRPPANARLRRLVGQLLQLRPVLEDPARQLWLQLPGEAPYLVTLPAPEPDPARPLLADTEIEVAAGVRARVIVRRAAEPIPLSPSRATRLGGLVIRSGRAAHETTLAGHEGEPGTRHLYGEVICDALEELQRAALESPRPHVVVKVDRSGLNDHHPVVQRLYAGIERVLRPIVAAEERRAGAHLVRAGRAVQARDQVGLRALNDALRNAFDAPGAAGFERGGTPTQTAPRTEPPAADEPQAGPRPEPTGPADAALAAALRFKQSPVRLHPGEERGVSLVIDPARVPPGTRVEMTADAGLRLKFWGGDAVPEPNRGGWSRMTGTLRARVTVDPGARLMVIAEAAGHLAELEVLIVRHRASGWVSEIARKDEDALIEAHFDPESGIVTVYEGRPEFKALERAARRAGFRAARAREYLPYRMLEVEAAANAVYAWAAEQIVARRLAGELRSDPVEYAHALRYEAQSLRHRAHEKLMRAFLDPEVFSGGVRVLEDG